MKSVLATFMVAMCLCMCACTTSAGTPLPSDEQAPIVLPCGQKLHMISEYKGQTYVIRPMREGEVAETYTAFYRSGYNWEIRECDVAKSTK